jgi:hypothetical protein
MVHRRARIIVGERKETGIEKELQALRGAFSLRGLHVRLRAETLGDHLP